MMINIGNRFGFLIPLFVFSSEAGIQTIVDAYFGVRYSEQHAWVWGIGLFPTAIVCWLFGQFLRGRTSPVHDEPDTDHKSVAGSASYARYAMREIEKEDSFNHPPDSFFFLAMYLWGPILVVIGIIVLLADWLGLARLGP